MQQLESGAVMAVKKNVKLREQQQTPRGCLFMAVYLPAINNCSICEHANLYFPTSAHWHAASPSQKRSEPHPEDKSLPAITQFLGRVTLLKTQMQQETTDTGDKVRLMTIHASKVCITMRTLSVCSSQRRALTYDKDTASLQQSKVCNNMGRTRPVCNSRR